MTGKESTRRRFLQVMMSLPIGLAVGCRLGELPSDAQPLARLVLALGPWPPDDRATADAFVARFLEAEHLVGLYLPESGDAIARIAERIPDGAIGIDSLDLSTLMEEERELVVSLTQLLYSLVEVRFYLAGEPPWGVCEGERTRYQQAPEASAS